MKLILPLFLFSSLINAAAGRLQVDAIPTHYLKPPKLQPEHIGTRILCHRPMRTGTPNMSIETRGAATIMHNYGHGGEGLTLAPGCVRHLLRQFHATVDAPKDDAVVVIGAGIIGLLTAYMLRASGHTNVSVVAERFEQLTSHNAGGFCAPTNTKELDPATKACMDAITVDAYTFYAAIARGENKDFDPKGAQFMPVYLMPDEQRLAVYEGVVMQKPTPVVVDFSNGKKYEMKVYLDAIFINASLFMASLMQSLRSRIFFATQRVESFDEISAPYIFNCAGLGAKELNNDASMRSGQGHLVLLQNQTPKKLRYMIGFKGSSSTTASGAIVHQSVYMFPKQLLGAPDTSVGVLGGTYIEDADATTPHEEQFDGVIERARDFFGQ